MEFYFVVWRVSWLFIGRKEVLGCNYFLFYLFLFVVGG